MGSRLERGQLKAQQNDIGLGEPRRRGKGLGLLGTRWETELQEVRMVAGRNLATSTSGHAPCPQPIPGSEEGVGLFSSAVGSLGQSLEDLGRHQDLKREEAEPPAAQGQEQCGMAHQASFTTGLPSLP